MATGGQAQGLPLRDSFGGNGEAWCNGDRRAGTEACPYRDSFGGNGEAW